MYVYIYVYVYIYIYIYIYIPSGDSMSMEDPDDLDLCCAVWTAVTYVVANLEDKLPRTDFDDITDSGFTFLCNIYTLVYVYLLSCIV